MNERNLEDDKLLTMNEALAYLKIGRTTMYRLLLSGDIKGYKLGNSWRFFLSELRDVVKSGEVTQEAMRYMSF